MRRLRDYIIDGLLLVLPIAVAALLLKPVVEAIANLMAAVSSRLPEVSSLDLATEVVIARASACQL